jgi:hypothetical protein
MPNAGWARPLKREHIGGSNCLRRQASILLVETGAGYRSIQPTILLSVRRTVARGTRELRLAYGTQSDFWRLGSIHRWKNRGPTPRRQAADTTERWRASYGSWLVSFGLLARVKSCLTLHCDTTEEPTALTHETPPLPGSRMNRSLCRSHVAADPPPSPARGRAPRRPPTTPPASPSSPAHRARARRGAPVVR